MRVIIFLILTFCFTSLCFSAVDTASTGNWSSSGTWQSGSSPGNGDTLVIPAGVTVTVNCNCGTYSDMYILVLGTLNFPNGKKINLTSNGRVDIFTGGTLTGGNGGSKLNIGGNTVWDGGDPDITGPSSCISSGCGGSPLPVELLSFRITPEENVLNLYWTTATETNNDYFTISISEDLINWNPIKDVDGAGNSAFDQHYSARINQSEIGNNKYVRLTQTDFDGQYEHLTVESLQTSSNRETPIILENPSIGKIKVLLNGDNDYIIEVYNQIGSRLLVDKVNSQTTYNSQTLRPGTYVVRVSSSIDVQTYRVVVM